jgi:hypothetical protein
VLWVLTHQALAHVVFLCSYTVQRTSENQFFRKALGVSQRARSPDCVEADKPHSTPPTNMSRSVTYANQLKPRSPSISNSVSRGCASSAATSIRSLLALRDLHLHRHHNNSTTALYTYHITSKSTPRSALRSSIASSSNIYSATSAVILTVIVRRYVRQR